MSDRLKIKFLFSGNFDIDCKAQHYEEDDVIAARLIDAAPLIDGQCAEVVPNKPKPKSKEVTDGRTNSK
jgi:hypothetical protein